MIDIYNIGPQDADEFELKFKKHPGSLMRLHHPNCGHHQLDPTIFGAGFLSTSADEDATSFTVFPLILW